MQLQGVNVELIMVGWGIGNMEITYKNNLYDFSASILSHNIFIV